MRQQYRFQVCDRYGSRVGNNTLWVSEFYTLPEVAVMIGLSVASHIEENGIIGVKTLAKATDLEYINFLKRREK